jgi:hypothetical protein
MRLLDTLALAAGTSGLLAWLFVFLTAWSRGSRVSACPVCHSNRVRPSWPKSFDKLLQYTAVKPFRCEACLKRFYAMKH